MSYLVSAHQIMLEKAKFMQKNRWRYTPWHLPKLNGQNKEKTVSYLIPTFISHNNEHCPVPQSDSIFNQNAYTIIYLLSNHFFQQLYTRQNAIQLRAEETGDGFTKHNQHHRTECVLSAKVFCSYFSHFYFCFCLKSIIFIYSLYFFS